MMERVDVIVQDYGLKLGKCSERLTIKRGDEVLYEQPLRRVRTLTVSSRGISISSDLLAACARHHIPVSIVQGALGTPQCRMVRPGVDGEAATRRAQLVLVHDTQRAFRLAKEVLAEKCRAQLRLLRYVQRRSTQVMVFDEQLERLIVQGKQIVGCDVVDTELGEGLDRLMGHEGMAARCYWNAWGTTLGTQCWQGRHTRGARDPVNMALNYGYALLREQVWAMCERAHMDAYAGIIHRDRAGRPGCVLDLMEPWRMVVDDAVGSLARRARKAWEVNQDAPEGEGLAAQMRKEIVREVLGRLNAPASFGKRRARVAACMQQSVRKVASYVRGESEDLGFYRWDVRGPKRAVGHEEPDELERFFNRR